MDEQIVKKQNKKVTIFAIVLSVISIGLLVVGFLLVSSDKVVLLQSMSNLSNKLESFLNNDSLYDKIAGSKNVGIKTSLNLNSDYANINTNLVVDYLENKGDKKSKLNLDLAMSNQDILGVEGVLANDNLYVNIDNITPSYYHTALEYTSLISSLKSNDYDKLLALFKESIIDNVDNDEIKKEKVTITYNGKDKKVNKLSYDVTNKAIANIINDFVKDIKKDKELLKNIANYMGKTTDEVVTELDSFIKELTYDEVTTVFYYNVYYYGFNKIVRYELSDVDNKPVIEYKVEGKETINFYGENETVIISIEVEKKKNQNDISGFIVDSTNNTKIPFTGNLKDDTLTLVITTNGVNVKFAITSTEDIKDNSFVYKNKIVLSVETQGVEITIGTLDINLEYYFNQKVNADVSNSMDVSQMTETDLTIIQNNIMNHPLYQMIMGMVGTLEFSL